MPILRLFFWGQKSSEIVKIVKIGALLEEVLLEK